MAVGMRLVPPPSRDDSTEEAKIRARLVVLAIAGLVALVISVIAG